VELLDGLDQFKNDFETWELTENNEKIAQQVLDFLTQFGDHPSEQALTTTKDFLVEVEKWKAMCLKERAIYAVQNTEIAIWRAFRTALNAKNDIEAILSIMVLKGFGTSEDLETSQRRAKAATAVLRFLMPDDWGVVDWRTTAMLSFLNQFNGNVDQSLFEAKKWHPSELRELFDIVDEHGACDINGQYRTMRNPYNLPRTADVDMALFGFSFIAWKL